MQLDTGSHSTNNLPPSNLRKPHRLPKRSNEPERQKMGSELSSSLYLHLCLSVATPSTTSCCMILTHNIGKVLCDGRVSSSQLVQLHVYLTCGWPSPTAIQLTWRFTTGLLITSLALTKLKLARSQQVVG
jgi:hypothetical protein